MAKGYWIVGLKIKNADQYAAYRAANAEAFRKYGARFLVRAGRATQKEGALRSRHVVIEFKDYATALACYESPDYQNAFAARRPPVSTGDLVIIEGYDGIQPA